MLSRRSPTGNSQRVLIVWNGTTSGPVGGTVLETLAALLLLGVSVFYTRDARDVQMQGFEGLLVSAY